MLDTYNPLVPGKSIVGKNAYFLIRNINGAPTAQNTTGGPWTILRDSSYEIKPKSNNKETPNTTDGILRTAGLFDYEVTVKGHTNPDDPIESNVMPGDVIDFRAYRSGSYTLDNTGNVTAVAGKYWAGRVIIDSNSIATAVDEPEDWDLAASKQSGVLTLPNNTVW